MPAEIIEILNYVKQFNGSRLLLKLGGSVLDDRERVQRLCEDFSLLQAAGITLVIVHGGGKAIDRALQTQAIAYEFSEGLRITSPEMMDTIETVLCGHINRLLVRTLNSAGVAAVGLAGGDAGMLQCNVLAPQYGRVGEIQQVNTALLEQLLHSKTSEGAGIIPVIAPIGVDAQGQALNINADWAASRIAVALGIHKLIYLTDQNGILDNKGNLMPLLDASQLHTLIADKIVTGGMLTKAKTVLNALQHGLDNIHIINATRPHSLLLELFTNRGSGTLCTRRALTASQAVGQSC